MSSNVSMVEVRSLNKSYLLYDRPSDRLKQFLFPKMQRVLLRSPSDYYREFRALKDVNLSVNKGETVGLIGRNGAGKSTLLQIICGTLAASSGEVQVNGKIAALLELGAGFMPEFTGLENIYTYATVLGLTKAQIDERLDDILSFADIGSFVHQPIKTYSSGMMVRLAFAVATAVRPDVLVVDEALSVGDIAFQNKCLRHIQDFISQGGTTLFVSHSATQISTFCDRAYWMHEGAVREEGPAREVVRKYVNFMRDGYQGDSRIGPVPPVGRPALRAPHWTTLDQHHQIDAREGVAFTAFSFADAHTEKELTLIEQLPQRVRLNATLVCERDIAQPLVGIGCFNSLNQPIVHFNTAALGIDLQPMHAGTTYQISITFALPLIANGDYLLALGIDDGLPGESVMLCHVHALRTLVVNIKTPSVFKQYGFVPVDDADVEVDVTGQDEFATHS